jgi:uncharacterized membrane-anchored protein
MRTLLIWLAGAFVFGNFYTMIAHKETLLREGQTVYLELQPVDPRSLMQGDYMAINYTIMNHLNMDHFHGNENIPPAGRLVIQIDAKQVGTFVRYDDSKPLAPGEHLLKFHHSDWRAVIGAESFFIPEGSGEDFARAVYGELKLEPDGTPLIVALCDKNQHRLVAKSPILRK